MFKVKRYCTVFISKLESKSEYLEHNEYESNPAKCLNIFIVAIYIIKSYWIGKSYNV